MIETLNIIGTILLIVIFVAMPIVLIYDDSYGGGRAYRAFKQRQKGSGTRK